MRIHIRQTMGSPSDRPVQVKNRAVPPAFEMELEYLDGRPDLILGFEVRDGVPQCRRAELRSTDEGREVLASDLRGVKLEDLLEIAVAQVAMVFETNGGLTSMVPASTAAELQQTLRETRTVRREARRRVTDDVLREVAEVYRKNIGSNPTAAVAAHIGRSHRTAGLYVQRAREAGFLGKTTRGKAGEQP